MSITYRKCFISMLTVIDRNLSHLSWLETRGAGSIFRRRGQLPEKGTFSMTNIRIITKKASLTFPILLLRLGGGGGYLNMFEGRGTCKFLGVHFSKKCRNYRYQFLKFVQNYGYLF